jgi:hypothetical protein
MSQNEQLLRTTLSSRQMPNEVFRELIKNTSSFFVIDHLVEVKRLT